MTQKEFQKRLKDLKDVCNTQSMNGNWNYNSYMHGFANGLILAISIMDGSNNPDYFDAPEKWLEDIITKRNTIINHISNNSGDELEM